MDEQARGAWLAENEAFLAAMLAEARLVRERRERADRREEAQRRQAVAWFVAQRVKKRLDQARAQHVVDHQEIVRGLDLDYVVYTVPALTCVCGAALHPAPHMYAEELRTAAWGIGWAKRGKTWRCQDCARVRKSA